MIVNVRDEAQGQNNNDTQSSQEGTETADDNENPKKSKINNTL